jgi:pyruvate,water dikinase
VNKLWITQVRHPHPEVVSSPLIKGIGASRGRVTSVAYVRASPPPQPEKIPQGVILIAPLVTPDWLPLLQEVVGIVTEQGGMTSHAAILSRELGIPAIVNAKDATSIVQSGERLMLDGDRGEVYRLPTNLVSANSLSEPALAPEPILSVNPVISQLKHAAYPISPMIATKLLVNLSQSHLIQTAQNLPVDGLGLLRSELMMLNVLEGKHPQTWLQNGRQGELLELWSQQIAQFAQAFTPRPVFYRSLDWRSPDLSLANSASPAKESILGVRGTFSYLLNPALFELELQALARVQANYPHVNLLLPFVRTVEEFVFCQRKVEQAGLTKFSQFQLWIMVEVPNILFLLPEYIKAGVAGVSIGTNDLTQLMLGVDRENGQLAQMFDERHPAVMGAIAQIIKMAQAGGIPCAICGQAPAHYPEIIDQLVQWGITAISVEPKAVEQTYQSIARAEHRLVLAAARQQLNPPIHKP